MVSNKLDSLVALWLDNSFLLDSLQSLSWSSVGGGLCLQFTLLTLVAYTIRRYYLTQLHQHRLGSQESDQNLQLLFESNPTPMWTFDVETLAFLTVNQAAIIHYGFTREEFLALTIADIRPAEEVDNMRQRVSQTKNAPYLKKTWPHQLKNGQVIEVEITSRPIHVLGRSARLVMANDITQRQKAEADRYLSEQSFKALVENSPDVIARLDRHFRYCYVNQAMEKVTGQKADHYLGRSLAQLGLEPERLQLVQGKFQRIFDEQTVETDLAVVHTPHGVKYFQSVMVPELDVHGRTVSVLSTQRDITELIEARHTLEQTNKNLLDFKFALDKAAIVSITDAKGRITYLNEEFCQVAQYSHEELLGERHRLLKSGYHPGEFYGEMWRTISSGQVWKGDICNRRKDGSHLWLSCTIVPFLDSAGTPYQYLSIQFDITARKLAEESLVAANAELDTFVYRASHDIRGPLARLMGLCSLGLLEATEKQALEYFKLLEEGTQHLNHILLRLLSVNTIKHWQFSAEPIAFPTIVEEAVQQISHPEDIGRVDFRIHQTGPCRLVSDPSLLKLVLQNVIENGIRFRKEPAREPGYVHLSISTNEDHSVQILVIDNGIGIREEIKDQVFNMFFRGTARSDGSGLGLYITRLAVEKLGGHIRLLQCGSQPTVFAITLPSGVSLVNGWLQPEAEPFLTYA